MATSTSVLLNLTTPKQRKATPAAPPGNLAVDPRRAAPDADQEAPPPRNSLQAAARAAATVVAAAQHQVAFGLSRGGGASGSGSGGGGGTAYTHPWAPAVGGAAAAGAAIGLVGMTALAIRDRRYYDDSPTKNAARVAAVTVAGAGVGAVIGAVVGLAFEKPVAAATVHELLPTVARQVADSVVSSSAALLEVAQNHPVTTAVATASLAAATYLLTQGASNPAAPAEESKTLASNV